MKHLPKELLILVLLFSWGNAQLKSNRFSPGIPVNNQGLGYAQRQSFLDPSRFNMHQSFSISMSNAGGQSLSVGMYTNQMNFMLKNNLRLQTQFSLVQPNGNSPLFNNRNLGEQVFYGASLEYQPRENLYFSFSLNNYPTYGLYRPYSRFYLTP
ncbi:MAG: hypothetical protein ACE5D2_06865 [Fidelibacterota bacterium]